VVIFLFIRRGTLEDEFDVLPFGIFLITDMKEDEEMVQLSLAPPPPPPSIAFPTFSHPKAQDP